MALFLIRKGQKQPTRLNMRAGLSGPRQMTIPKNIDYRPRAASPYANTLSPEAREASKLHPQEKILNVLFIYNGHTWDAFEVLGLPAGAPMKMVEESYRRELAKSEPASREFIDSAYQSIRSQNPRS